jgi:hypothetical protein
MLVPCTVIAAAPKPVVREGGLRVVVAAELRIYPPRVLSVPRVRG